MPPQPPYLNLWTRLRMKYGKNNISPLPQLFLLFFLPSDHQSFDCGGLATQWRDVVLPASATEPLYVAPQWVFELDEETALQPTPSFLRLLNS